MGLIAHSYPWVSQPPNSALQMPLPGFRTPNQRAFFHAGVAFGVTGTATTIGGSPTARPNGVSHNYVVTAGSGSSTTDDGHTIIIVAPCAPGATVYLSDVIQGAEIKFTADGKVSLLLWDFFSVVDTLTDTQTFSRGDQVAVVYERPQGPSATTNGRLWVNGREALTVSGYYGAYTNPRLSALNFTQVYTAFASALAPLGPSLCQRISADPWNTLFAPITRRISLASSVGIPTLSALKARSVPWLMQPQVNTGADWASPLCRGLVALVDGRYGRNAVTGSNQISTTTTPSVSGGGVAQATAQGAGAWSQFDYSRPSSSAGFSFLLFADYFSPATAPNSFLFGDCDPSGPDYNWGLYSTGGNFCALLKNTGGTPALSFGGATPATGQWRRNHRLFGVYNGSTLRVYQDGIQTGSTPHSGSVQSNALSLTLNRADSASGNTLNFFMAAAWSRALSDAEIRAISANPWQLFAPRRQFLPFAAASGIPTLSGLTFIDITASSARPRVTLTF